jgi:hypothetical protein
MIIFTLNDHLFLTVNFKINRMKNCCKIFLFHLFKFFYFKYIAKILNYYGRKDGEIVLNS